MNAVVREDMEAISASNLPWDELAGSAVLVTGASGMLGGYLTEALLTANDRRRLGMRVVALARNQARVTERLGSYRDRPDLRVIVQDVCEPLPTGTEADYILHFASQANPRSFLADPVGTVLPNVIGTNNLLAMASANGARGLLFCSSGEVYGQPSDQSRPVREDDLGRLDPLAVRSCYGEAKRMGEVMCAAWHHQHGVPAKVVRLFHTYGPGMPVDDGRVFADFVGAILSGRELEIRGDGRAVRSFCYLVDAVIAFLLVLLRGRPAVAYNVGNARAAVSVKELAERLVGLFPERGLNVTMHAPGGGSLSEPAKSPVEVSIPDTTRLESLGWAPAYGIDDGFRRTVLASTT